MDFYRLTLNEIQDLGKHFAFEEGEFENLRI